MLAKPDHPELTIEALVKWLRTLPPDETYIWSDPVFCMMGQYLLAHDSTWGAAQYSEMPGYAEIAAEKPWTFGAALERAEKLLALPAPTSEMLSEISVTPEPLPELEFVPVSPVSPKLEITEQELLPPPKRLTCPD